MHELEQVLAERSAELIHHLTYQAGFSRAQAARFLTEAGPALLESYQWQAGNLRGVGLATPESVPDLLAGVRGRALAFRVGLSVEMTWAGLRTVAPAVVRALRKSGVGVSWSGAEATRPRGTANGAAPGHTVQRRSSIARSALAGGAATATRAGQAFFDNLRAP